MKTFKNLYSFNFNTKNYVQDDLLSVFTSAVTSGGVVDAWHPQKGFINI